MLTRFTQIMAPLGLVLAGLFAAPLSGEQAKPNDALDLYERKASWQETMLASRAALNRPQAESDFKPFVSGVIRGGKVAQQVAVDVAGLNELWLIATDGGNGIGCDHSVWADPKLIAKDGSEAVLSRMEPMVSKVGWFKLNRDKDCHNRPIRVAGKEFKHGLFAHANSVICYRLDRKYVKFSTWIGVCESGRNGGSVVHKILDRIDRATRVSTLWPTIEEDFPFEAAAMKRDLPRREHLKWFARAANVDLEKRMIGRVLDDAGRAGARMRGDLGALIKAKASPQDRRWLDLYTRAVKIRDVQENMASMLQLARKTLAYVERSAPRPKMAAELVALEAYVKRLDADWETFDSKARSLRRRIILSHPLLDFDELLICKRPPPRFSHQCDQYLGRHSGEGDGLVVLENWKDKPKETVLLKGQLPKGSVLHPDLSFDAKRVLFSFCDHTVTNTTHRRFFIYEAVIDGSEVRQVTGTAADPLAGACGRQTVLIEDWDPCYLPDGGIMFISTRNQNKGRCHGGRYVPSYLLYRMNGDGSDIRQMSFGESNEWDPSVLHDGRTIYTRWDYINRHDTLYQSLWVTRPDGTGTAHFYGNYTRNPCLTSEAKAIPGSHKIVCTAAGHHAYTAGSIIVVDPLKGEDGAEPLTRVTPEIRFPETEGWPKNGTFATPYPLSEDLFLAAFSPHPLKHQGALPQHTGYAIYLVDTFGGRELIYRDPGMSCFAPIPVVPRPKPQVLSSSVASKRSQKTGTFYVQDVYESTQPIPRGSIKRLRINQIIGQPTISVPSRSAAHNEIVKRVVGTVPVNPDGSAAFRAPAGAPLQLQILDENGMAVMTMRSFVYLHPGEAASCVGCHEPRSSAPVAAPAPAHVTFHNPEPPAGPRYEGGFSFARTVQPVLDQYCIGCHGLEKTEVGVCLLGTPKKTTTPAQRPRTIPASAAYDSLVNREGMVKIAQRNREAPFSKPKDYFAHAGKLAKMLLDGHQGHVKLDRESFQRIVDWLDLNAQYYGDYSFNRPEQRIPSGDGEKTLREHIEKVFGPKLAKQPFAALVNVTLPSESRVLKAPLARQADGWGQITENCWSSANDPGYQKMLELVEASIQPLQTHDVAGTCAHKRCRCRSCWVRAAENEYRKRIVAKNN